MLSLSLFRYEAHKGGKFTREQLRRLVDPSNLNEKAAEASTIGKCTSLNPCQATRLGEWWNREWKWKSLETSYSFHRSPTFLLASSPSNEKEGARQTTTSIEEKFVTRPFLPPPSSLSNCIERIEIDYGWQVQRELYERKWGL